MTRPTLIVVSGPAGSGKTTLAHALAAAIGCPAICRDEIKEGMTHATGEFTPGLGDELSVRTLPTFFGVLELLLTAGVTAVAEAAFQDHVWRPRLAPLQALADIRIVRCTVDREVAWERIQRRRSEDPRRRAHPDSHYLAHHATLHTGFNRVTMPVPSMDVDTSDGYHPTLTEIVAFVNQRIDR